MQKNHLDNNSKRGGKRPQKTVKNNPCVLELAAMEGGKRLQKTVKKQPESCEKDLF